MQEVKDKIILVTGATGQQGGAVSRELVKRGWKVRAMTRSKDKDEAKELEKIGMELVEADYDNDQSLRNACNGVWGVFAVQTPFETLSIEKEVEWGKKFAKIAKEEGIQHFVQASVVSASENTGIPHFESKNEIEQYIRTLHFPYLTILRPVFFMENLINKQIALKGDTICIPLNPGTMLQMIAVEDIGKFAAIIFEKYLDFNGQCIEIAGDELTIPMAVDILAKDTNQYLKFQQISLEDVRKVSPDLAKMFEWFEKVGYSVDIPSLSSKFGIKPMNFSEWASKQQIKLQ